jgi:hypothetical protein
MIGASANVGADNLNFATAIGAGAVVSTSNTVVLGRNVDTVGVPGALNVTGAFGIGTTAPRTKLHLTGGKIYVEANGQGVILKSPGGACFELTVTDAGALATAAVACP